jgi:hypothetical protein
VFSSFFLAGFECTTGMNKHGQWIDQIAATRHDSQMCEDYARLEKIGIKTVREGVRWPIVQLSFGYDFSSVDTIIKSARIHGIEVIYDLFHFGYPAGLDLFSNDFLKQFGDYCGAVSRHIVSETDGPYFFTPVNEPSYFSWAAGDAGLFAPHLRACGAELKIRLVLAIIEGISAIRSVCPQARFINVDPLCRVVAPPGRPDLEEAVEKFNTDAVFQCWDMLSGRTYPELGGRQDILDIVGINYYWTNQWVWGQPELFIEEDNPKYQRLRDLVLSVAKRYPNEILISETGNLGPKRSTWLDTLAEEAEALLMQGTPLRGICLYPILSMPEWHDPSIWTQMGLWDLVRNNGNLERECHKPMMKSLANAQKRLQPWHSR